MFSQLLVFLNRLFMNYEEQFIRTMRRYFSFVSFGVSKTFLNNFMTTNHFKPSASQAKNS